MLLALVLSLAAGCTAPAEPPAVLLSPEPCDTACNLTVPASLVRGGISVLVGCADDRNFVRVDLRGRSVSVTHRQRGEDSVIGRAALPKPTAEGVVVVKCRPTMVAVAAEGRTVCRAPIGGLPGASWGLLGGEAAALEQIALQLVAAPVFTDDFMRGADEAGAWSDLSGHWRVAALDSADYSANAFLLTGEATGREPARAVAGDWFWEDYTVEAAVRVPEAAACFGLGLYADPGVSHHLLRCDGRRGVLELVRISGPHETVLAATQGALRPGEWRRVSLTAVATTLTAALDGQTCLTATDDTLAQGQALLQVEGEAAVEFDDVTVYAGPRVERRPVTLACVAEADDETSRRFAGDHYMEGWADERDQWRAAAGAVWHAGHFWGEVALTWQADAASLAGGATLHLCAPTSADPSGGYELRVTPTDGRVAVELLRGGAERAQGTAVLPDGGASITLRRSGARVEALVGDETVAAFEDDAPLSGGMVGLTAPQAAAQPARLQITAWNVLDSAFRAAPTEWRVVGGRWDVQSRWACTPRWSWFGGRSPDLAAIWTRDAYPGDVVVEFFAGFRMDTPFAPFYQHPSNIAVTLCGDGATPGSGYSFILGANGNRETIILRRGEIVARSNALRLPDILDGFGGGTVGPTAAIELHKEWEHLRAERLGDTVRLLLDGKPALEYTDPDPLPGGAVGIWTLDNGLAVARARVYYQEATPAILPKTPRGKAAPRQALPPQTDRSPHVAETFEPGAAGWATMDGECVVTLTERDGDTDGRCLLVANPRPGGSFAVAAPVRDVDLARYPVLAFDYAIPPEVRVDVWLTLGGGRFRLRLTGPEAAPLGAEDLGYLPDLQADGQWRHAEVDLLARLRPFFRDGGRLVLEALEFAYHGEPEYLVAGIGGNPMGASYRLDNLFLGASVDNAAKPKAAREAQRVSTEDGSPLWREPSAQTDTPYRWDFERDAAGLQPWGIGGGATVRWTHGAAFANPVGGNGCAEVSNTEIGGMFGIEVASGPFDATRHPTLSFDYRVPDALRVDLLIEVNGTRRTVKFTDNDATWPVLGTVGATADGQWHRATVDLQGMLRQAFPAAQQLLVTRLGFASSGWPGNRRGTTYWLDNVELPPLSEAPAVVATEPPTVADAAPLAPLAPLDNVLSTGFEGIGADDPAMWGNFLGCQVVRSAEGGATGPGCLELRDLKDGNGACFALITQLSAKWQEHPRLQFRYRTRKGSAAQLSLRGTTYNGTDDLWTVLATFPPAGAAWQNAEVDLAQALQAADPRLTMHRVFLDLAIPDPDDAVLIDDYALGRN